MKRTFSFGILYMLCFLKLYGVCDNPFNIDLAHLNATQGFVIRGAASADHTRISVNSAGDINGDGLSEIIVGAYTASPKNRKSAGESYVIYGQKGGPAGYVDLANLDPTQGFVIEGAAANDAAGYSVRFAGDVNGDGLSDIIIGAPNASPSGRRCAGASYVIYGRTGLGLSTIDLGRLEVSHGFVIWGAQANDGAGTSVSSAGDVNGDGLSDIIIGAPDSTRKGRFEAGASYVLYGQKEPYAGPVDLARLTSAQGFIVYGDETVGQEHSGYAVSTAGDVNGDGFDDIIIGAPDASPLIPVSLTQMLSSLIECYTPFPYSCYDWTMQDRLEAGASYVIYGQQERYSELVDLRELKPMQGFVIQGAAKGDSFGSSVSSVGDVSGDGLSDIFVGGPYARVLEYGHIGAGYVVYGSKEMFSEPIDLAHLKAEQGFKILGASAGDQFGNAASALGDINGDGLSDFIVGAQYVSPQGRKYAGTSYVLYGKKGVYARPVDLAHLVPVQGFLIEGACANDFTGSSVGLVEDFNGDGIDDLIVGAQGARNGTGAAYVIYGRRSEI